MWAGCTEVKRLPTRPANYADKRKNALLTKKLLDTFTFFIHFLFKNFFVTIEFKECDVIVVEDTGCIDQATRRKADIWGIPITTFEWVIQCLIHGSRLPFDAHAKFQA